MRKQAHDKICKERTHPQVQREVEASLAYSKPCLRKEKNKMYWVQWSFLTIAALRRLRQYCLVQSQPGLLRNRPALALLVKMTRVKEIRWEHS